MPKKFNGKQMTNLTVLDRSQRPVSQIVVAQSAEWNVLENIWDFYNGTIYLVGADGSYNNIVRFEHQQLALPKAALDITKKSRKTSEMNIFQARKHLERIRLGGRRTKNSQMAGTYSRKNCRSLRLFGICHDWCGVGCSTTGFGKSH